MKESATIALEYIKSNAKDLSIELNTLSKHNIHIHVPEGATPKDGPSAGITMLTSLVSLLTQKRVKSNLAMTGEITLRGKVLPIGGLKEKLLAALRAGTKTVLIPKENEKDLIEIPKNIQQHIDVRPVRWIDEVFEVALEKMPKPIVKLEPKSDAVKKDKIKKHDENELIRPH